MEKKTLWVAYTNTDRTEGRGRDVPHSICVTKETAQRLAKGIYVQGANGPVRPIEATQIDGIWYWPLVAINVIEPSEEDKEKKADQDARKMVLDKAKAAGLTEDDLLVLVKTSRND